MPVMDNCCDCNQQPGFAQMQARFNWPGWAPFTACNCTNDMAGVRYRTLTCNQVWVGTKRSDQSLVFIPVSATISCDQLNNSFLGDPLTGTQIPANVLHDVLNATDPNTQYDWELVPPITFFGDPNVVVTDTKVSIPAQQVGAFTFPETSIVLTNPINLAFCKSAAGDLMFLSGGIQTLKSGQIKQATWKQGPDLRLPGLITSYLQILVDNVGKPDPITGIGAVGIVYIWGSNAFSDGNNPPSGIGAAPITIQEHFDNGVDAGYPDLFPFPNQPRVFLLQDTSLGGAASSQFYGQLNFWEIDQCKLFVVTKPACIEQEILDTTSPFGALIDNSCFMQSPLSDQTLTVPIPDLKADATLNSNLITNVPNVGLVTSQTSQNGCPCVTPPP